MKDYKLQKNTTPTYNPQRNIVERCHRTLYTMLKVFMERDDKEWAQYLPAMTSAYNTKVHASTGVTPFYATFGREARLLADLVLPTPGTSETDQNQHIKNSIESISTCKRTRRQQLEKTLKFTQEKYMPKLKIRKPVRLTNEWVGPYKITEQVANVLYKIQPVEFEGYEIIANAARLLKYKPETTTKSRIPKQLETHDEGEQLGEELL